MMRMMASKD